MWSLRINNCLQQALENLINIHQYASYASSIRYSNFHNSNNVNSQIRTYVIININIIFLFVLKMCVFLSKYQLKRRLVQHIYIIFTYYVWLKHNETDGSTEQVQMRQMWHSFEHCDSHVWKQISGRDLGLFNSCCFILQEKW